jgi:SAM-dependent methyltransferase
MTERKIPFTERALDTDVPEILPYLRAGNSVLDVGCGPGTITRGVAQRVSPGQVVGIDAAADMISRANELAAERPLRNLSFRVMDMHALDFADATFDVVFSHTAFHGFVDPVRALKEQKRVTKKGGWVIASGVRDWGLVPRYPPTPLWDKLYNAWMRHAESMCARGKGDVARGGGHPQAARRVPEWLTAAGLTDFSIQLRVYRQQYYGSPDAAPHPMDMLPYGGDDPHLWYAGYDRTYRAMIDEGLIEPDLPKRAVDEARAWYADPRAFHFWVMLFAAAKV